MKKEGDRRMTLLILDPGHGGSDPGAVYGQSQEKFFTLKIALKVRDYLLSMYNVDIIMTRTTDKTVSLKERTDLANERNADYFCSIHINAGGGTGWESYIYNGPVSKETIKQRDAIHQSVMDEVKAKYRMVDRGKKLANFHVLRESSMPAILLENLFIDTEEDLELLQSNAFLSDLSKGIAEGLAQALSLSRKILFKVIAGSFESRLNAVDRQKDLSSKGIESIILEVNIEGKKWFRVQAGAFQNKDGAQSRQEKIEKAGIKDVFIISE